MIQCGYGVQKVQYRKIMRFFVTLQNGLEKVKVKNNKPCAQRQYPS